MRSYQEHFGGSGGRLRPSEDYLAYEIEQERDKITKAARRILQKEERMVRGKFTLQAVTKHHWSPTAQTFVFRAIYDTTTEENRRFSQATPTGELTMTVDNPPAQEFFELGKTYYLDFSKAE